MEIITKNEMIDKAFNLDGYKDFSDGVNIEDFEFKKWISTSITRAIKETKEGNLKESFSNISSGNGLVFVEVYRQKNNLFTVFVNITRNYKSYSETNVEL